MKAAIYTRYGSADTVHLAEHPTPAPGPDQVLVRVHAASVTTADWRMRAAAYPGILWLPGRLMTGLFKPKQPVLGTSMAGEIVATGAQVTRFRAGQRVFGFVGSGAHAEYVAVDEDAALVETPEGLTDAEAAALPFGALSALVFLRDVAQVQPGQDVLIVGASGGVGAYATQIAKALGARVTAVAGPGRETLLSGLGADRIVNYREENPAAARQAYDVVLDTVGATTWPEMRRALKPGGLFVPLNFTGKDMLHALRARFGKTRVKLAVSGDTADDLRALTDMIGKGEVRAVIDSRWPFDRIAEAHAHVEARHSAGTVIVEIARGTSHKAAA